MAGQIELAIDTSLGTISCAMNPVEVAQQVLKAAQSLQDATAAAHICEGICTDIRETTINRLPIVCELLRLGQLFPEREGVADLNQALLRCFKSICDALHDAVTAMYKYLQCSKLSRLRQAASLKELIGEKRTRLTNRFNDVDSYMHLATLLRSDQSAQQAQHTAALVQELAQQVRQLERVHTADTALVKARAKAALAGQVFEEREFHVISAGITFTGGWTGVCDMALSPCGGRLAAVGRGASAAIWDIATGTCMHKLSGHRDVVRSVAWSPDGSRLATSSEDRTLAVWDAATGRQVLLHGLDNIVMSVAWSPHGSKVATGPVNKTAVAAIFDAASGILVHELRGHSGGINSVAWSPDGSRLATGSNDTTAAVWDVGTGMRVLELRGHRRGVHSVAWSPDGSRVATGSHDSTAAVWDAATGTLMHELKGHSGDIRSVAWSPDGSRLATGSLDKTAAVWDAAAGTRMHELRPHGDDVTSVAWSPGGDRLYTASDDGSVRIYQS